MTHDAKSDAHTNGGVPRRLSGALLAAVFSLAIGASAVDDSWARAPRVSPRDRASAAQQHPQIVAQFGGAVGGPTQTYVDGVGQKIATAAGLPGQCTFTVISSEVVNAFAVPGCYIYITRGLLAIMNSEDELASVLGHEVGHITAEHSSARQTRGTIAGIGAIAVGILTKNGQLAQLASQAGQLYTLSYSRGQEFEADDRGVSYLITSGYNPFAASDMLQALGVNDALAAKTTNRTAGSEIPAWARSHPMTQDRVTRAAALAQRAGASRATPVEKTRPYLQSISGLIYGDDPEQGFVNGRTFAHPKLKIAFDAPQGFTLTNTTTAVLVAGPNNLKAQFAGGPLPAQGGLDAYAAGVLRQLVGQSPVQTGQVQRSATNGLETSLLPARAQTQSGQVVDIAVSAYRVGAQAYHFVTLAPAGAAQPMAPMLGSFRVLTDAQAAALRARSVEIVEVTSRDTVQSLAQRMAFTDYQAERFLALNGRDAGTPLRAGELVKIVSYAR
ncbi:MAG: peptidase M48 Ste24p [Alphaproteobacteria bacterium]|nr:MAG: peptidase M48 Ste24p [Caulobacteraceae bacterium]TPW04651.1 MAG: peptidase M48 Ste24p [Alphaproteobacteria bacterium]